MAPEDFDVSRLPGHLRVTFRVLDEKGRVAAEGKDLSALKTELQADMRQTVAAAAAGIERSGLREWNLGALPRTFEQDKDGHLVTGYPALVDEGTSAAVRVLHTQAEQEAAHWVGVRRLLLLGIPSPVAFVQRHLTSTTKLVLSQNPDGSVADLIDDCTACAADALIADAGGPAWNEAEFAVLRDKVRGSLIEEVFSVVADVERALPVAHRVRTQLSQAPRTANPDSVADARHHLGDLVHPGFVTSTGRRRLPDLVRYLKGLERRVEKFGASPHRDLQHMETIARVQDAYNDLLDAIPPDRMPTAEHDAIRWMIEELAVSLFAQELRTAQPVSEKRILRAVAQAHGRMRDPAS